MKKDMDQILAKLAENNTELDDNELLNVSGGCGGGGKGDSSQTNTPASAFNVGDLVVYKNAPTIGPATVTEKDYNNTYWRYKVSLNGQEIGYLGEEMLQKYSG